ncbi:MAG: dihydroorotase, partial [Bacteroidales bacterium]|nr:dihydroorotase [Bacteroidales bacterium]
RLVEALSAAPRRIFRLPEAPQDYVEVDLDTPFTIHSEDFASMGKATPFEGWEVYGKVCRTVRRGKTVFSL